MYRKQYDTHLSLLDMNMIVAMGFALLFLFAYALIQDYLKKDVNIKLKAEFVITVTWPDNNKDDVDTYLQDPLGNLLYFQKKDIGTAHLDRDDVGMASDTIILENGVEKRYNSNREITQIRAIIPGEWILNIHMYKKNQSASTATTVEIVKLNPYKVIHFEKVVLTRDGEEETILRFTLSKDGEVISKNKLFKPLFPFRGIRTGFH